jgi:hypothetical protein
MSGLAKECPLFPPAKMPSMDNEEGSGDRTLDLAVALGLHYAQSSVWSPLVMAQYGVLIARWPGLSPAGLLRPLTLTTPLRRNCPTRIRRGRDGFQDIPTVRVTQWSSPA